MKKLGFLALVLVAACSGETVGTEVHALSVSIDGVDVFAGSYDEASGEVFLINELLEIPGIDGATLDGVDLQWQGAFVAPGLHTGETLDLRNDAGHLDLRVEDATWVDGLSLEEVERRMSLCLDFGLV